MSSSIEPATFSLIMVNPSSTACAAEPVELVVAVPEPSRGRGVRRVAVRRSAAGAAPVVPARPDRRMASASSRLSASEMYRKSTRSTICSGDSSDRCSHSGCPARLARRSHSAFSSAPTAMWMTPFSGPSQRSWASPVSSRPKSPRCSRTSSTSRPAIHGSSARMAATWTSLPRPVVNVNPCPAGPSSSVPTTR